MKNISGFMNESGFKVLALARLSPCEYSIVLYLINCALSGMDQFVTNETELASLIGYDDNELRLALTELFNKKIIRLHYGEKSNVNSDHLSFRVGIQYNLAKWILTIDEKITSHDAIVFPFRRQGEQKFVLVDGDKKPKSFVKESDDEGTWRRILESYVQNRSLDDDEIARAESGAKILIDTHPVDQVLLMLRHFGTRIPSLSLLASSWQHYQEIFENETQKVDMMEARQKHHELDDKVREQAQTLLGNHSDLDLNEEELGVLQILIKHRHPRRQLFWAYQLKNRYPGLSGFFADNVSLMLPVTSGGIVIKKDR
jgi:hypothetical protein